MNKKIIWLFAVVLLVSTGCKKENRVPVTPVTIVKEWTVALRTQNVLPAPESRTESGTAKFVLKSDRSLEYTIQIPDLSGSDQLTMASIRSGEPLDLGNHVLPLTTSFSGSQAAGTVTGLSQGLADSLKSGQHHFFVLVRSSQHPTGLVRGELTAQLAGAANITLTAPASDARIALRLDVNQVLYSRITVTRLEISDTITNAQIYNRTGELLASIGASHIDFTGAVKKQTVNSFVFGQLKSDSVEVRVISKHHPDGVVRGLVKLN